MDHFTDTQKIGHSLALVSEMMEAFEVPTGRGSGDAVLRTNADRIEHANETGTSELH